MKKLILLGSILFLSILSFGQQVSWAFYLDGQMNLAQKAATDLNGNVFVLGETNGYDVDFDPGTGTSLAGASTNLVASYYIAKYSESGAFLWVKILAEKARYFEEALYIDTDDLGNVYIAGAFRGNNVDFDPGTSEYLMGTSNASDYDAFVQKLDANGNFVFANRFEGTGFTAIRDIVVKGTYLYFPYDNGSPYENYTVAKWTTSGAPAASRNFNSQNGKAVKIALDNDLNIYVLGYFNGLFSSGTGLSSNLTDIYIVKFDGTLLNNSLWVKGIGGPANDMPKSFVIDGNNNITLAFEYSSTASIDVDPGVGVVNHDAVAANPNGYTIKIILVKLDTDGNYIRSNELVNSNGYAIINNLCVDSDNNIYTNGYMQNAGSMDFDFSANLAMLTPPINGQGTAWIQKIDENGIYQTAFTHAGGYLYVGENLDFYVFGGVYSEGQSFQYGTIANPFELTPLTLDTRTTFLIKYEQCSIDAMTSVAGTTITATSATGTYQWINCATNTAITGATSQSFTPTATGNYAVVVSSGSCSDTSVCTPICIINNLTTLAANTITATQTTGTYQWIDCATSTSIAGANSQSFTPTVTGNYAVIITDGSCSDTSVCTSVTISSGGVGIEENSLAQISMYPNPTTGMVTFDNIELGTIITIQDAAGRVVNTIRVDSSTFSMNVSNLENSFYFVTLKSENGNVATKKLIVRK